MTGPLHHHVSKVLLDDLYAEATDIENVVTPARHVRIITVNGEMWENNFKAFGLTETQVVEHWDANEADMTKAGWRKI